MTCLWYRGTDLDEIMGALAQLGFTAISIRFKYTLLKHTVVFSSWSPAEPDDTDSVLVERQSGSRGALLRLDRQSL